MRKIIAKNYIYNYRHLVVYGEIKKLPRMYPNQLNGCILYKSFTYYIYL